MKRLSLLFVLALAGCPKAPVGAENAEIRPDSARMCAAQCQQIGMGLQQVVIMAENIGCVCGVEAPAPSAGPPGGGMAAILMQEAAAEQQRQQSQQSIQRQQQQSTVKH